MEAHKGLFYRIVVFVLDTVVINILRNAVVYIKQRRRNKRGACDYVLGDRTVHIGLAGYRYTVGNQPGVYIAGNKFEFGLERRPAFIGKRGVF